MRDRSLKILFLDTLRPVYVAVGVGVARARFPVICWPTDDEALLGAALTASAVVAGFLVSAQAIVLSSDSRGIERMRLMGAMVEVVDRFAVPLYFAIAFIVLNTAAFFDLEGRWFEATWFGLAIGLLYSFLRLSSLFFRLVRK